MAKKKPWNPWAPSFSGAKPSRPVQEAARSFAPYVPPPVPAGSYDPALDAAARAAQRGLGDLTFDVGRQGQRDAVDYGLGREDLLRARDRGYQDLDRDYGWQTSDLDRDYAWQSEDTERSYGSSMADLKTGFARTRDDLRLGRSRMDEDYGREISMLQRGYQLMAGRQGQAFNASGLRGGAQLQAAAKRAENMALDRQPLDTNYQRGVADNTRSESRLGEDYVTNRGRLTDAYQTDKSRTGTLYNTNRERAGVLYSTNRGRLGEDTDVGLGRLGLGFTRASEDRATQLERAQREGIQFGLDTEGQKAFQAAQAGYVPPPPPSGTRFTPSGQQYREVRQGNYIIRIDPNGREISRRLASGSGLLGRVSFRGAGFGG